MKKERIKKRVKLLAFPVLLMVLGLVLAINPDSTTALVTKILAWFFILCGVLRILEILTSRSVYEISSWIWAAVWLCAGLFLLKNPLILAKSFGLVLGIMLLVYGADGLYTALRLKAAGIPCTPSVILSAVIAMAGLVLILVPMTASRLVITVCGLVLIFVGVISLLDRIRDIRRLEAPDESNIIDADE